MAREKEAIRGYSIRSDEVLKCERNYQRNHLRWYRITRIKRGRRGERKVFAKEKERKGRLGGIRGSGGKVERLGLTSKA